MTHKINWEKFNAISMRFGLPLCKAEIDCLTEDEINDFNSILNVMCRQSVEIDYLMDAAKRRYTQKELTRQED